MCLSCSRTVNQLKNPICFCVYQDVAIKVYFGNEYSEGTLQDYKKEVFRNFSEHLFDC